MAIGNFIALEKATLLYQACKKLNINSGLKDQLLRATSSVALNLSEGASRRTGADRRRFYFIAFGSLRECQTIIKLEDIVDPLVEKSSDELAAILYVLCNR